MDSSLTPRLVTLAGESVVVGDLGLLWKVVDVSLRPVVVILPGNIFISVVPELMGEIVDSPRPEVVEWAGEGVVPVASGLLWTIVDSSLWPKLVELTEKWVVGVELRLLW